jgi:hypothetical protein
LPGPDAERDHVGAGREGANGEARSRDPLEALRGLEQRLEAASEAAERLLGDAARQATRRVPPKGWHPPGDDSAGTRGHGALFGSGDADLLLAALATVRDRIPPELQQRLADALREVLEALRALIDWYLQRSERPPHQPADIQDIPIL